MNKNITELFCFVDDFCKAVDKNFAEKLLPNGRKPTRTPEIKYSEIMTIILLYHQSRCENFKSFYLYYLKSLYSSYFPTSPSYDRFIALKPRVFNAATAMDLHTGKNNRYIIHRCYFNSRLSF